ncbi:response regulator [Jannaschia seohaensis]|uniref:Response regulator receiver domain-containing protein n=1 Tax=Jannaschia seohaensis TaxID=475081 RepID=A0A2Y9B3W9_9RHOB|nr:response regulator [Jannaschia seohaensis]PWJ14448.1 response regulator receiver domain-containing protein [Jannaschia seohaensis]SSA50188.1 Response regulator receiver domain-containing protein [Jannaschia seohaensis]
MEPIAVFSVLLSDFARSLRAFAPYQIGAETRTDKARLFGPESAAMLNDMNILVVEDEALVALDISMILEERGAAVCGPCGTIEEAYKAIDREIDAAILDVDLHGRSVFPVADRLREKGTPFVFHTGRYDTETLEKRYGGVPVLEKPAGDDAIVKMLARLRGA